MREEETEMEKEDEVTKVEKGPVSLETLGPTCCASSPAAGGAGVSTALCDWVPQVNLDPGWSASQVKSIDMHV